jgi:hypothetical protein
MVKSKYAGSMYPKGGGFGAAERGYIGGCGGGAGGRWDSIAE